jgi:hypothetical protein
MEGLKSIGFIQSQNNMCLLWRELCVLVYDNTIVTGPDKAKVKQAISEGVEDFLGVIIAIYPEKGENKFSQPS